MKKTVQAYIEEIPNWQDGSSLAKHPYLGCNGWFGALPLRASFLKA